MRSTVIFHCFNPTFSFASVRAMATLPWTTAKLVPEALKHRLHVVEDPAMIHLLGRAKFVELIVFGPVGWQQGVSFLHLSFFLKIHGNLCCLLLPRFKSRELLSVKVYTLESANLFLLIVIDFLVLEHRWFYDSLFFTCVNNICCLGHNMLKLIAFVHHFWKDSNSSVISVPSLTTLKSKHIHLDLMFFKSI